MPHMYMVVMSIGSEWCRDNEKKEDDTKEDPTECYFEAYTPK